MEGSIERAISKCKYFVVCISEAALRKTGDKPGFQDEELNRAYNIAEKQSSKDFYIVPVRIEECGRGDSRLSSSQQYDLFDDFEKSLDKLAVDIGGSSLSDSTAKDERSEEEKTIDHLLGKARAASYAAEYDKSIAILNTVLTLYPENTTALNYLGVVWNAKGQYDKAIEYYEKALTSDINTYGEEHPNVAIEWNNLGETWRAKGQYDKAIEYYEKALKSDINSFGEEHPSVARDWNNLGGAWHSKDQYDKAIEYYEKALKVVRKAELHHYAEITEKSLKIAREQRDRE